MIAWPEDTPRSAALLAIVAIALLALIILLALVTRVGTAIAAEVHRAQSDYLRIAADRPGAIDNALKLGQCLRRQMLMQAVEGIGAPRDWVRARRAMIEPECRATLEPLADAVPDRRRRRVGVIVDSTSGVNAVVAAQPTSVPIRPR